MNPFGVHLLTVVAGATGAYYLREYFAGGVCTSTARLDNKTVIITGCNRYVYMVPTNTGKTSGNLLMFPDLVLYFGVSYILNLHFKFTVVLEKTLPVIFTIVVLELLWRVETWSQQKR